MKKTKKRKKKPIFVLLYRKDSAGKWNEWGRYTNVIQAHSRMQILERFRQNGYGFRLECRW